MENKINFDNNTKFEFFTNGGNDNWKLNGLFELLIIGKKNPRYFVNRNANGKPTFIEYDLSLKSSSSGKDYKNTRFDLIDMFYHSNLSHFSKYRPTIKVYRQNDKVFADFLCGFYFLDKFENISVEQFFKESTFRTLPDNVYQISHVLTSFNDSSIYIECYKKFNPNKLERKFFIFTLGTNEIKELIIKKHEVYRDGGTTDMVLIDEGIEHTFHWDTPFRPAEQRHHRFDDIELFENNEFITDDILNIINKSLSEKNIVLNNDKN